MRRKPIWYADFETTQPNENGEVRLYLWCLCERKNYVAHGHDIKSFMLHILEKRAVIYFHNLKFDSSYITYYLLNHNIEFDISEKNGVIYSIKFNEIELRDSMNLLPMSLKEVGETYCKNYHKLEYEDYLKPYDYKPNYYDIRYCEYDVLTLKEGLTNYLNELKAVLEENGAPKTAKKVFKKLTNAGICYEAFKEITKIDKICEKTTREMYNFYKPAYIGGFVYAKGGTYIANNEIEILMLDENSMYPDKYANYPMPIGRAFPIENEDDIFNEELFCIINITIKFKLRKGFVPIISQGFNKSGGANYLKCSEDFVSMTITNVDLKYILIFYDCEWCFNYGWKYRTKRFVFKKYADIFMKIKSESKGIRRDVAKRLLNMCYGKTAMSGVNEKREYYINELGSVSSRIISYEEDDDELQYFQIGIAICSYARADLWSTMLKVGIENVLYTDTDSIKFLCKDRNILININIDDKKLGFWKIEGNPTIFKPLAPKKYIYYENETLHITSAGFNHGEVFEAINCKWCKNPKGQYESVKLSQFEALKYVNRFDYGLKVLCKQSRVVEGGRLISIVEKEIKMPR